MGGQFEDAPTVHLVRDVSPGKVMLCVTFRVPEAVAFHGRLDGMVGSLEEEGAHRGAGVEDTNDEGCERVTKSISEAKRQRTWHAAAQAA